MKKIVAAISILVGLALIAGLFWWLTSEENVEKDAVAGSIITYRDSGFSPPVLRTTSGTRITIENKSSKDLEFASNPHPSHADNPELNTDVMAPGDSAAIVITNRGTWGYHNHLDPGHTGRIILD